MKKLLRLLTLVPLLAAVSLNAFAVTASVTVNATSSGTITSTQLGSIAGAGGGLPPGFCECSGGRSQGGYIPSSGSYDGAERHNTWSSGSYTITAGTNAIALNITDTPSGVASLDQAVTRRRPLTSAFALPPATRRLPTAPAPLTLVKSHLHALAVTWSV